jgi:hypothetical protein
MSSLELLSALNWIMVVFYVGVGAFFAFVGGNTPAPVIAIALTVVALLSAPHVYLGLVIEKGRGRVLQTVMAVLSLLNLPCGTLFGAFALWVCWGSSHVALFDSVERDGEAAPRRRRVVPAEGEALEDELPADDSDQTPLETHAVARRRPVADPDLTPQQSPAVKRRPPRR